MDDLDWRDKVNTFIATHETKLDALIVKTTEHANETKKRFEQIETQLKTLLELHSKWKQGLAVTFFLGGIAVWILDHLSSLRNLFNTLR